MCLWRGFWPILCNLFQLVQVVWFLSIQVSSYFKLLPQILNRIEIDWADLLKLYFKMSTLLLLGFFFGLMIVCTQTRLTSPEPANQPHSMMYPSCFRLCLVFGRVRKNSPSQLCVQEPVIWNLFQMTECSRGCCSTPRTPTSHICQTERSDINK